MFYYQHIGHMQFSTLTLHTLRVLEDFTNGKINLFVPWNDVRNEIQKSGFTYKQADSELDRFCYGFECIDVYSKTGIHQIALTSLGRGFIDQLLAEHSYQQSQIACIMRPARKKNSWNVIVQESTFFNPEIYDLLKQYSFRQGPARDFLKCLPISVLFDFVNSAIDLLSPIPFKIVSTLTLSDCIRTVEEKGKYWASVGGKYSWFVFGQEFTLPINENEWKLYQVLVKALVRPPEWGGGHEIGYSQACAMLDGTDNFNKFRNLGIIRPRWVGFDIENAQFRLTAPGYLMWERITKGFCYEFKFRRELDDQFSVGVCQATDFVNCLLGKDMFCVKSDGIPSKIYRGNKSKVMNHFLTTVTKEQNLSLK